MFSDSVTYQLTHRMHFELAHNVGAMGFRCLDTDPQNYSDFLAAVALRQELHNLALSRAQAPAHHGEMRCRIRIAKAIDQDLSRTRCKERAISGEGFDANQRSLLASDFNT